MHVTTLSLLANLLNNPWHSPKDELKTLKWASIQVPRTRFACYFKTVYINYHTLRKYNISISALWMSQFWQLFLNCWSKLFAKKSNYICLYLWVGWGRFPNILVFGPRLVLLEEIYVRPNCSMFFEHIQKIKFDSPRHSLLSLSKFTFALLGITCWSKLAYV